MRHYILMVLIRTIIKKKYFNFEHLITMLHNISVVGGKKFNGNAENKLEAQTYLLCDVIEQKF